MIDWIQTHIPPWVFIAVVSHLVILGTVAYLILLERKVASWAQDRLGPNRVGLGFGLIPWLKDKKMWGLGQPLADGLKFIFKEDYRPAGTDKYLFTIAPALMITVIIVSIAVIPWGGIHQVTQIYDVSGVVPPTVEAVGRANAVGTPEQIALVRELNGRIPINSNLYGTDVTLGTGDGGEPAALANTTYRYAFQAAKLNIGVLFIIAVLSLAVYGVVIGGWASNNKYSFLGGLRATAQMISYEIPLGLSLLAVVVMFGTLELGELVEKQAHYWVGFIPAWNVFTQPLAFLMFLICIHAEANRAPFDMAEAEQELVGGYHTEYSSMRFALFFLAEYAGMITTSAVCVALFFGGWHFPGLGGDVDPNNPAVTTSLTTVLLRSGVFFAKTLLVIFVFMWTRWSLPRFRFDQLMMLAWRALIPMSLVLVLATAVTVYFVGSDNADYQQRRIIDGPSALAFLAMNAVVLVGMLVVSKLLPAPPETNRKMKVAGSRYDRTPVAVQ